MDPDARLWASSWPSLLSDPRCLVQDREEGAQEDSARRKSSPNLTPDRTNSIKCLISLPGANEQIFLPNFL